MEMTIKSQSTLMRRNHNKYKECYYETKLEGTEITAFSDELTAYENHVT